MNINKLLYSFKSIIRICLIETFLRVEVPRKQEAVQRRKRPVILGPVVIGRASEMLCLQG